MEPRVPRADGRCSAVAKLECLARAASSAPRFKDFKIHVSASSALAQMADNGPFQEMLRRYD